MSTATRDPESILADRIAAFVRGEGKPDRVSPLGRLTCTTGACGLIAATALAPLYQEVARRTRFGESTLGQLIATIATAEVAKEEAYWDRPEHVDDPGGLISGHLHLIETCVRAGLEAVLAIYPNFAGEYPDEAYWAAWSAIDHDALHPRVTAAVEAAFDAYEICLEWDGW